MNKRHMQQIDVVRGAIHDMLNETNPNVTHELEARLGTLNPNGSFSAGVDPRWFEAICIRMENCKEWSDHSEWVESEDTTFNTGRSKVRQSRICNPDECAMELVNVSKSVVNRATHPLIEDRVNMPILGVGADHIRVSHSREVAVTESLPVIVEPLHVRIKQRRQFTLNSTGIRGAQWRFDMTRTWSGKNREEAESLQNSVPPSCEVEIEWISPPDFKKANLDSSKVAESLLNSMVSKLASLKL